MERGNKMEKKKKEKKRERKSFQITKKRICSRWQKRLFAVRSLPHLLQNLRAALNNAKKRKYCCVVCPKDTGYSSVPATDCFFKVPSLAA